MRFIPSNTFLLFLLPLRFCLINQPCFAECKLGNISIGSLGGLNTAQDSALKLQQVTGCNFVFEPVLQSKMVTYPQGDINISELAEKIAAQLNAKLRFSRTLFVFSLSEVSLTGTGKLVSLELTEAPVVAVNQIIKKLGSAKMIPVEPSKKITATLQDIPLDDLPTVLDLLSKTN